MAYQPTLPAEKAGFKTTTNLTAGTSLIYNSPLLDANGYTQVQTEVSADQDGTMTFEFLSDAGGTDVVRTLVVPYTAANGYQLFAAPAFTNYIRYEFDNNSGSDQTDFYFTTKLLSRALSPQTLRIDGFLAPAMMSNVSRAVIVGQDGSGNFSNCTVVKHTNTAGTYSSLSVAQGARPSEVTGRTAVRIVADTTAPSLEHTVSVGKTFYVTDILLTIDNADQNNTGRLDIYDSLVSPTVEPLILPLNVRESPTNETSITIISHVFTEPIEFSSGVWFEETSGTLTMTGIINGYEE